MSSDAGNSGQSATRKGGPALVALVALLAVCLGISDFPTTEVKPTLGTGSAAAVTQTGKITYGQEVRPPQSIAEPDRSDSVVAVNFNNVNVKPSGVGTSVSEPPTSATTAAPQVDDGSQTVVDAGKKQESKPTGWFELLIMELGQISMGFWVFCVLLIAVMIKSVRGLLRSRSRSRYRQMQALGYAPLRIFTGLAFPASALLFVLAGVIYFSPSPKETEKSASDLTNYIQQLTKIHSDKPQSTAQNHANNSDFGDAQQTSTAPPNEPLAWIAKKLVATFWAIPPFVAAGILLYLAGQSYLYGRFNLLGLARYDTQMRRAEQVRFVLPTQRGVIQSISSLIESRGPADEPTIIAIEGDWGTGKSTIVSEIQLRYLQKPAPVLPKPSETASSGDKEKDADAPSAADQEAADAAQLQLKDTNAQSEAGDKQSTETAADKTSSADSSSNVNSDKPEVETIFLKIDVWKFTSEQDLHFALFEQLLAHPEVPRPSVLGTTFFRYPFRVCLILLLRYFVTMLRGGRIGGKMFEFSLRYTSVMWHRLLETLLAQLSRENFRVVWCLDEIDRASPTVAQHTVLLTRRFLNFPGSIVLLPYVKSQLRWKVFNPCRQVPADLASTMFAVIAETRTRGRLASNVISANLGSYAADLGYGISEQELLPDGPVDFAARAPGLTDPRWLFPESESVTDEAEEVQPLTPAGRIHNLSELRLVYKFLLSQPRERVAMQREFEEKFLSENRIVVPYPTAKDIAAMLWCFPSLQQVTVFGQNAAGEGMLSQFGFPKRDSDKSFGRVPQSGHVESPLEATSVYSNLQELLDCLVVIERLALDHAKNWTLEDSVPVYNLRRLTRAISEVAQEVTWGQSSEFQEAIKSLLIESEQDCQNLGVRQLAYVCQLALLRLTPKTIDISLRFRGDFDANA